MDLQIWGVLTSIRASTLLDLVKAMGEIVDSQCTTSTPASLLLSSVTIITEILMSKCGVAAVMSVAENRHGRTSSSEAGSAEIESTPSGLSTGNPSVFPVVKTSNFQKT